MKKRADKRMNHRRPTESKKKRPIHHKISDSSSKHNKPEKSNKPKLHKPLMYDPPAESLDMESPQVIAERDGWLILYKPAGWLTHSDGRSSDQTRPNLVTWAQEYFQKPIGVHQRLDITTSGLLAFSVTKAGAQVITESIQQPNAKKYLAVVEGQLSQISGLIDRPTSTAPHKTARTRYKVLHQQKSWSLIEATPLTGRTHQIRIHCASLGTPIRGDGRYGDAFDIRAPRALLHAYQLTIKGETFTAPIPNDFTRYLQYDSHERYIEALLNAKASLYQVGETTCYRVFNGGPEGFEGWRVDRYGDWQWIIHDQGTPFRTLPQWGSKGIYRLDALVDRSSGQQSIPYLWQGEPAPKPLHVLEAGVEYAVELGHQLSTGLFLDQRPQRSWLAKSKQPWGRVLNTFAHAGGFSIAASIAGAETTSIDLSAKWLDRIPAQLKLNNINSDQHVYLTGDVFDWLRRLHKRGERFNLIILDPPSTSIGTKKKRWSAARDYPELVRLTLPLLEPGGRLLTCTNHRKLTPHKFVKLLSAVLPYQEGYRLERVCAPAVDFPSDETLAVKNLIWRSPK